MNVRSALRDRERVLANTQITAHVLAAPELADAGTVAAYVSFGTEPATAELLERLTGRGIQVILPVLLDDRDVDWAEYEGPDRLGPARYGLREPTGRRRGVDAVLAADAVLVPALAVRPDGIRLGRGGGSYDRVLTRIEASPAPRPWVAALLFDGETGASFPAAAHDRAVDAAITPAGVTRYRPYPERRR